MALPSTGGSVAATIQPGWDPLKVRYGQIVGVYIRDYLDASGNVRNLADPACGLGSQGVFSPFAQDGNIRTDLLWSAGGGVGNQGWFNFGLTKEDSIKVSPEQSVQQTPTGQTLRSVRNVYTKLEDKVMLTPLENSNLVNRLRYNLALSGWTPDDGTAGAQLLRGLTDTLIERQLILFLIDGNQLIAEVYPRLSPDKTGSNEFGRKSPYAPDSFSWDVLGDPYSQQAMWLNEAGTSWGLEGDFQFSTVVPTVTPISGLKATVIVPTPTDFASPPTYTVQLQATAGGSFVAGTVSTPSPSISGAFTTVTIGSLTASQAYNALRLTATGGGVTSTTPSSAPFTATAS